MSDRPTTYNGAKLFEPLSGDSAFFVWKTKDGRQFCDKADCKHGACKPLQDKYFGHRPWPWEADGELNIISQQNCWDVLNQVAGLGQNMLFYGPPSTGKTYAALFAGLAREQATFAITMTEETPAAEIRGVFSPHPDGLQFLYGPGTRAMQTGGRLVVNELDRASNDALTFMYLLAESAETAIINLPNNEVIRPAPGYHVVATMNGDPYHDLPEALHTRFGVKIFVDMINPVALEPFPKSWRPIISRMCLVRESERRTYLREWYAYWAIRPAVNEQVAARAVFGPRAVDVLAALKVALAKENK